MFNVRKIHKEVQQLKSLSSQCHKYFINVKVSEMAAPAAAWVLAMHNDVFHQQVTVVKYKF